MEAVQTLPLPCLRVNPTAPSLLIFYSNFTKEVIDVQRGCISHLRSHSL